ncbi:hypothetical protein D3C85_661110 [compost metagenome]
MLIIIKALRCKNPTSINRSRKQSVKNNPNRNSQFFMETLDHLFLKSTVKNPSNKSCSNSKNKAGAYKLLTTAMLSPITAAGMITPLFKYLKLKSERFSAYPFSLRYFIFREIYQARSPIKKSKVIKPPVR